MAHSKYVSTVTSNPASAAWAGTIRSTAVFANTAFAAIGFHSAASMCFLISSTSTSVALIAFSHAITASLPGAVGASPAAITGATKRRMVGPTAVVTMSARAISAITSDSWVLLLRAR